MEIFVCARAVVDHQCLFCLGFLTVVWMDGQRQGKDEEELYTAMMAASQPASRPLAAAPIPRTDEWAEWKSGGWASDS
jgi:hypothetical protein